MRFRIHTLVDITQTNARRTDNGKEYKQQQNYMTALQTLGLRANIIPNIPQCDKKTITKLGFGSNFKGSQQVWSMEFTVEHQDALNIQMLEDDFDFVPL